MEPQNATVLVDLNSFLPKVEDPDAGDILNLRQATIGARPGSPRKTQTSIQGDTIQLDNESLDQVAIRMYVAPQHRHNNDVALIQMSIGFFASLKNFNEELDKMPEPKMGFRASAQTKIDLGEYLGHAKALSQFCTSYVFTIDAPTEEDSIKRKIALDCASVAEGFLRAVKSVSSDIHVTKDTAGFMSGIFAETAQAMRILTTQLSMIMIGGNSVSYVAEDQ